ncbi:MAG: 30S ribosomal protein S1 [Phototrophicaceae bacterium]|jgi:small subunit ribosomal protein S1
MTQVSVFPDFEVDFAMLLEESFGGSEKVERGDTIEGVVLIVDSQGLVVDVNQKRDGLVPRRDLERMNISADAYQVGQKVDVTIVRLEDEDGNFILSISQARQSEDWKRAELLMNEESILEADVADANKGGLIIPFGNLRGFIPASHVADLPRGLSEDERKDFLVRMIGQKIAIKVIEVNHKRRRLVFSQREAQREHREARKEVLLDRLQEGQVIEGIVSGLRDFGAFVDLGGADGLIHISELAWHRVKHPKEVLNVGDHVKVYVLRLDEEGKRIGLSLKRLQKNPWQIVEEVYHVGQLIEGRISRLAPFGAFVSLEPGIEALLHVSQLANHEITDPAQILREGQSCLMRIISIEADKQRLGLSLKDVTAEESSAWQAAQPSNPEVATVE